ncbi:MAG: PD-(D/E)XK motif protein [Nitrospiria bacterium]
MKTSEILSSAWKTLEEEDYSLAGYYERRIFAQSNHSLFAGIFRPSNHLLLCFDVSLSNAAGVIEENTKGFSLYKELSPITGKARLRLELTNVSYRDLFLVVSTDILNKILEINDQKRAVAVFRQRLEHWKKFMQVSKPDGLSKYEQIGLFGELIVLRALLKLPNLSEEVLGSWRGPKRANQDFIYKDRALEIKTTTINDSTRLSISNERQLDSKGLALLFLCHISIDERYQAGLSLPVLVDEIANSLHAHLVSLFNDSLLEAGYHDSQRNLYIDAGYIERGRKYYRVNNGFPRITPVDLRVGVSDVEYQIDLSGSASYLEAETQAFDLLFGITHG